MRLEDANRRFAPGQVPNLDVAAAACGDQQPLVRRKCEVAKRSRKRRQVASESLWLVHHPEPHTAVVIRQGDTLAVGTEVKTAHLALVRVKALHELTRGDFVAVDVAVPHPGD